MKKISFFLLLTLLLSALASCTGSDSANTTPSDNSSDTTVVGQTDGYGNLVEFPGLEAVNYEGKDFTFLVSILGNVANYGEISGLSYTQGDIIDDAIYKRDDVVMNKYNLNFKYVETNQWRQEIEKTIMGGDNDYQVLMPGTSSAVASITAGHLYDLNTLPNVDFSKPWWNQSMLDMTGIGNKNFLAVGDINLLAYDSIGVLLYNMTVADRYNVNNLFELYDSGKWTFDKFIEVIRTFDDINSPEAERTYGLVANNYSTLCFSYGIGQQFVVQDSDGIPSFTEADDRFVTFWQKYINDIPTSGYVKWMPNTDYKTEGEYTNNLFKSDKMLFIITMLRGAQEFRDMDSDYGIMPFPKYDETQEEYYSAPHQSSSSSIAVPMSISDPDMVGRVLEDMAYESHVKVRYKFIESHIKAKGLRYIEESTKILDDMFDNINYDIFFSFSIGVTDKLRSLANSQSSDIISGLYTNANIYNLKLNNMLSGAYK